MNFPLSTRRGLRTKQQMLCHKGSFRRFTLLTTISFPTSVWLEELKQVYVSDQLAQQQLFLLQRGSSSTSSFSLRHGLLFKKEGIYVPNCSELKLVILNFIHVNPFVGHSGFLKSLHRARHDFYQPSLKREVKSILKNVTSIKRIRWRI